MPHLTIDGDNAMVYAHTPPSADEGVTFVFFNALTGTMDMWEGEIGDKLRAAGHGTLGFNFRGQVDSPMSPDHAIDAASMTDEARLILEHVKPARAVLVGLSIGGLFAVQAYLDGLQDVEVAGIIFINTLRREGPRLEWINSGMMRCVEVGGLDLMRDLFMPLITNEEFQATARPNFLKPGGYTPLSPEENDYKLLACGGTANWDVAYEDIKAPVLVLTGQQDRLFYNEADVAERCARMPLAKRLDMANASHMLPMERPGEFTSALLEFAAGI